MKSKKSPAPESSEEVWERITLSEFRVPVNFRIKPELQDKMKETADSMNMFVYELWEYAAIKVLESIELKKKERKK